MARPRRKRPPPFVTLARHRRSDLVMRLRREMRDQAPDCGGRFASDYLLHEPHRASQPYNQWFDFRFPGADRFTIWNACAVSARKVFWDTVHGCAQERAAALLTAQELEQSETMALVPIERSDPGTPQRYKMVKRKPLPLAQFGGLSLNEQVRKLEAQIVRTEPPAIHESFSMERSGIDGIGLRMVLDAELMDRATIEAAIDRFLAGAETGWTAPAPVPRERLPQVSECEAYAHVDFWSGALSGRAFGVLRRPCDSAA